MYANWYNQEQRMGSTHSRSYEFLPTKIAQRIASSPRLESHRPPFPDLANVTHCPD